MEEADFSGYATKAGLKCSDGRTITAEAFKHQDKMTVPLVWQHVHDEPGNVLGHALLEARSDGIYCHGYFNDTERGTIAKALVQHKDVTQLSIYANQLVEKAKTVLHGAIREVSLVLSGANPGARIESVNLAHSDGEYEYIEDEAIIFTGLTIEHADKSAEKIAEKPDEVVEHADDTNKADDANKVDDADGEETVQEVYDSLSDKQKDVVHFMIGAALEASNEKSDEKVDDSAQHSAIDSDDKSKDKIDDSDNKDEGNLTHQEGTTDMSRNVFDQNGVKPEGPTLTHDQLSTIFADAQKIGSFKESVLAHAEEYGITDINLLFPDAQALTQTPEFISRRMEWVSKVLGETKHSPFAKVKTVLADITELEARAKGYIKGSLKKDEVFKLLRRTTGPATIYKKQKLDRDDMLDITDFDVINFLKAEMRMMIEEELARAILLGDGRSAIDEDKVKDPEGATDGTGIRSILHDHDLYSIKYELAANVSAKDAVKGLVRARSKYRGTGKPTLFVSDNYLTDIMLEEDKFGRPLYETEQALADKLRVKEIVTVDLFDETPTLFAIMVSLVDYTIGSNKGGELTSFEDFDIDYNQHKYLQETRLSGGLTKPYAAVVVTRALGTLATPTQPSFDGGTDTITIPTVTGVSYFDTSTDLEMTGNVVITKDTEVEARPDDGYYFASNITTSWSYTL